MLKVLTIGDPHAKRSSLEEFSECGRRSAKVIREKKPDLVVVMGDVGNDHEVVYTLCLGVITSFIETLRDACRDAGAKLVILVGNHDFINNSQFLTNNHGLMAFSGMDGVTIVDRPVILDDEKFSIVVCPYIPNGRFQEGLETALGPVIAADLLTNQKAIIFAHQEFLGAKMGAIVSKTGDVWPETGAFIFSGHVHERQELQKNILYVGAPYQQAFGDGDNKTISLFEFSDTFGLLWTEDKFDLGLPKKKTVNLTVEEAKAFVLPAGVSVRINLSGTREEILAFQKTKRYADLDQSAKINTQFVDAYVPKINQERKPYLDILREDCQKESVLVREAFDEVTQNANQDQKLQATL